jgi:peroxiredoxin/uncharacterized membrane protein YphA (DoxX/SURF4 family)
METVLLIARLLLASIFAVAGVAKLGDRPSSHQSLVDFGMPVTLAAPLSILLPLSALAVSVALILTPLAWWGAVGALGLLLLFIAGISFNLARGRNPDCRCFGQLHSSPAGWPTLARNGAFAAIGGFILWEGHDSVGPGVLSWLSALSAVQPLVLLGGLLILILLAVQAAQWWFLVGLLRQNGRLLVRVEALEAKLDAGGALPSYNGAQEGQPPIGLPVGSQAPGFSLKGLHRESRTLESLRSAGKPILLLFSDPNCGPCTAMLPEIGRWQKEYAETLTLALISRGESKENKTQAAEHDLMNVLLQKNWEVSEDYEVGGTPSAVLVSPDGKVASPVARGAEGIRTLLSHADGERLQLPMQSQGHPQAQGHPCPNCGKVHSNGHAAAQPAERTGPQVGEEAPDVRLADLAGKEVSLQDFKGKETLVLFWNPGCGFCQQMLPDLKELEASPPEDAPKLLVVSAGSEEANKEMGLASPMLLDQQFAVGRAFGALGTPSAVLVDAEGKVTSAVAVGAPAVLELAGADKTTT